MAINKKLIHFRNKSTFLSNLEAGNILDTSIVFIQDAKQIWTHGTLYDANDAKIYYTSLYFNGIEDGSTLTLDHRAEINHIIDLVVDENYIIYYGHPEPDNGYVSGVLDLAYDNSGCAFRVSQPDGSVNVYQPNGTIAAATTWKVTNIPVSGGGNDNIVYVDTSKLDIDSIINNFFGNLSYTTATTTQRDEIRRLYNEARTGKIVMYKSEYNNYNAQPLSFSCSDDGVPMCFTVYDLNYGLVEISVEVGITSPLIVVHPLTPVSVDLSSLSLSEGIHTGDTLVVRTLKLVEALAARGIQTVYTNGHGYTTGGDRTAYYPLNVFTYDGGFHISFYNNQDERLVKVYYSYDGNENEYTISYPANNKIEYNSSSVKCDNTSIVASCPSSGTVSLGYEDPELHNYNNLLKLYHDDTSSESALLYDTSNSQFSIVGSQLSWSAPNGLLTINNEANVTTDGTISASGGFFDTSDARVKTSVRELNAINADAIKLVEFDRTDIKHHGYGVIAQEVEKVYPSVVSTDADGFKSVNYNEIAMIKIKSLEDKVARLEALVARLESKLS